MYYVYILTSCKNNTLYKGFTKHLSKRLQQHNSGRTKSTRTGIPWQLIYFESFDTLREARNREKYFKTAAGRRWIKKHLRVPRPID